MREVVIAGYLENGPVPVQTQRPAPGLVFQNEVR